MCNRLSTILLGERTLAVEPLRRSESTCSGYLNLRWIRNTAIGTRLERLSSQENRSLLSRYSPLLRSVNLSYLVGATPFILSSFLVGVLGLAPVRFLNWSLNIFHQGFSRFQARKQKGATERFHSQDYYLKNWEQTNSLSDTTRPILIDPCVKHSKEQGLKGTGGRYILSDTVLQPDSKNLGQPKKSGQGYLVMPSPVSRNIILMRERRFISRG